MTYSAKLGNYDAIDLMAARPMGFVADDGLTIIPVDAAHRMPVDMAAGIVATASFTPIAGAYLANDIMGASVEFNFTYAGSGLEVPDTALIRVLTSIVRIDQAALVASEGAYELRCYNVAQPSAQADNDAWARPSGDLASYRGAIPLGTPVAEGGTCYIKTPNVDLDIRLLNGSLWPRLRTLAGFTVGAAPPVRQVTLYGIVL